MLSKKELMSQIMVAERADPTKKISSPADAFPPICKYSNSKVEKFLCITLNGEHKIIKIRVVSMGLLNKTLVHPREIFVGAIKDRAHCIILAHNHPSGNLQPSQEDRDITRRLQDAGKIIGIEVLDHMIISKNGFFSFLEEGIL